MTNTNGGTWETLPDFSDLLNDPIVAGELKKQRAKPKKPDPIELLREILTPDSAVTDEQVRSIVRQEIAARVPQVIELKKPGKKAQKIEGQHYLFPLMLGLLTSGLNLALSGPTGSGKTRSLINAAQALGLRLFLQFCSPITSKSDLFGFVDAGGQYRTTPFRQAFEEGGLYIADEFDCCNAGLAVMLNAAIGNRCVTFPDCKTVTAHKDFIFAVCMNTKGLGADHQYVGRNRLDAATLNRFVMLEVDYDPALEAGLIGQCVAAKHCDISAGGTLTPPRILDLANKYRAAFAAQRIEAIVSPRDLLAAATLSECGIGAGWVRKCIFERGLTPEQSQAIANQVREG